MSKAKLTAVGADANQQPTTGSHSKDKEATPMNSNTGFITRETIHAAAYDLWQKAHAADLAIHEVDELLSVVSGSDTWDNQPAHDLAFNAYREIVGRGGQVEYSAWVLTMLLHMRQRQLEEIQAYPEVRRQLAKIYRRADLLAADLTISVQECIGQNNNFECLVNDCIENLGKGLTYDLVQRVREAIPTAKMLKSHESEVNHLVEELHDTLEEADAVMAGHMLNTGGQTLWV